MLYLRRKQVSCFSTVRVYKSIGALEKRTDLRHCFCKGRRPLADFLSADKKSSLAGQCAVNSDKSATKSGLIGRYLNKNKRFHSFIHSYLTVLDLKTSCRAFGVRWTKTICRGSRAPQPMRNCRESHVNKLLFKHGGDRLGPKTKFNTWRRTPLIGISAVHAKFQCRERAVAYGQCGFEQSWFEHWSGTLCCAIC